MTDSRDRNVVEQNFLKFLMNLKKDGIVSGEVINRTWRLWKIFKKRFSVELIPQASIFEGVGIELCWHIQDFSFEVTILPRTIEFFYKNHKIDFYDGSEVNDPEDDTPEWFNRSFLEAIHGAITTPGET